MDCSGVGQEEFVGLEAGLGFRMRRPTWALEKNFHPSTPTQEKGLWPGGGGLSEVSGGSISVGVGRKHSCP